MDQLKHEQPFPQTDEEAIRFIPDNETARNLYFLYRDGFKDDIPTAMAKVLEAVVGIRRPKEES